LVVETWVVYTASSSRSKVIGLAGEARLDGAIMRLFWSGRCKPDDIGWSACCPRRERPLERFTKIFRRCKAL
jgi:hypothetical protein